MKTFSTAFALVLVMAFSFISAQAGPLRLASLGDRTGLQDAAMLARLSASSISRPLERTSSISAIPTRQEVWRAVLDALAVRGIHLSESIGVNDLRWAAPANTSSNDSKLIVQSVKIDRLLNQIRFHLRLSDQPGAPSFCAWLPLPEGHAMAISNVLQSRSSQRAKPTSPDAVALVSIRRPATLHLHSRNSSATLRVKALQSGELGAVVRVRVTTNGHTLLARVAGPDFLDASF